MFWCILELPIRQFFFLLLFFLQLLKRSFQVIVYSLPFSFFLSPTVRSKSGDTLLAGEAEIVQTLDVDNPSTPQQCSRDTILHGDDNYYSLLEENMYLLDQLKDKEEICSHLQNELDRLDDKTEKTNRIHQEEMGL